MTKEQKIQLVGELTEKFKQYPNFYLTDAGGLTVEQVSNLRALCFKAGIPLQVIKNTLIKKVLENLDGDYSELDDSLKLQSSVFFADEENPSEPAKIIQQFRKKQEKPILKAACIEQSFFVGDDQLDVLAKLKSKNELLGELVGLLQSPMRNVLGALQSGGHTLSGLLKTLSEREEN